METFEMITVVLGLCLGYLYRHFNQKMTIITAQIEANIFKEIDIQIEDLSAELKDAIAEVGETIGDIGNIHPEDQLQLLKMNVFQHFSNLAIQFLGKKLGTEMGVHQIEAPDHEISEVSQDNFDPS